MNVKYFQIFLNVIYPGTGIKESEAIELGLEFKKWLTEKFKDNISNLEKIWNIDFIYVAMNQDNPTQYKGYHPALVLNFKNFIEEMQKKHSE